MSVFQELIEITDFRNLIAKKTSGIFAEFISTIYDICSFKVQDIYLGNIGIKNFHKVTQKLYRGAKPKEEDIKNLKSFGITQIIDLRCDYKKSSKDFKEISNMGMKIIQINMSPFKKPTKNQIEQFIKAVDNNDGATFVHCTFGKERTGTMVACYRMEKEGISFEEAFEDMKEKGYRNLLFPYFKNFVEEYAQMLKNPLNIPLNI